MATKQIPLFKVFMAPDAPEVVGEVLTSGYIGQGPVVEQFEAALGLYVNNSNIVTVNSGTSALMLAARLIGIQPGDLVLTTPLTCFATNAALLALGARLRWVDVDPNTCNMCMQSLNDTLSECLQAGEPVKAIMVVHWGGNPLELEPLYIAKKRFGIDIIEDCAHAVGSLCRDLTGAYTENLGSMAVSDIYPGYRCYSFQAIKTLNSIEGGMLIPPGHDYERAKRLRWFGIDRDEKRAGDFRAENDIPEWGYKMHMPDVNAAVGLVNLQHTEDLVGTQLQNATMYYNLLRGVPGVTRLEDSDFYSTNWLYTVRVERREDLMRKLTEHGIQSSRVHERNDKHSCVAQFQRELPQLDKLCKEYLCLPVGWWCSFEDIEMICDVIRSGW